MAYARAALRAVEPVEDPDATVLELRSRIDKMQGARLAEKRLPTHPEIAELLPDGARFAGSSYQVHGSMSLLQAMLAGPSLAGAWRAVVGMPNFGIEAAATAGIDLDRIILVPNPGKRWWPALSTLELTTTSASLRRVETG